jgi:hypothetical protein
MQRKSNTTDTLALAQEVFLVRSEHRRLVWVNYNANCYQNLTMNERLTWRKDMIRCGEEQEVAPSTS